MTTSKRCALYLRVSTDRQTAENQLAEVQQLVAARGFEPVIYEEVESAAKARPVLDRMLADVRAGRVHAVAVWALDRLHRSMAGAINTVLELTGWASRCCRCARGGWTPAIPCVRSSWRSWAGWLSRSGRG